MRCYWQAHAAAENIGSQRLLWQIFMSLAKAVRRQDKHPAAEGLRQDARLIVQEIAKNMKAPLQGLFLALPHIDKLHQLGQK